MPPITPIEKTNVIELRPNSNNPSPVWQGYAEPESDLAKGLEAIANTQADFVVEPFLAGAVSAYEMILSAFAKGDKQNLKPLLSKPVFESFSAAIDQHKAQGESKLFQFVGMKSTKLIAAALQGSRATLEVQFDSEMINAVLDKAGNPVAGDTKAIIDMSEIWTFERDITSRDPNWKLIATGDVEE